MSHGLVSRRDFAEAPQHLYAMRQERYASYEVIVDAPPDVPRLSLATINFPVLATTLGVAVVVGVVFALIPTLPARRINLQASLTDGSSRGTAGPGRSRLRSALVVAELEQLAAEHPSRERLVGLLMLALVVVAAAIARLHAAVRRCHRADRAQPRAHRA